MPDLDALREDIREILDPEPDPDMTSIEIPHSGLRDTHNLDVSYLRGFNWEGSTTHPRTRICPADEYRLHSLSRNQDIPLSLFEAALRLLGDSILAYHDRKERTSPLCYYPPIILTFWAGFETFVRYSSELLLVTTQGVPLAVKEFLKEFDSDLNQRGEVVERNRYRPVLERYSVLLKYGYNYQIDRGRKFWQLLQSAQYLRDYYSHLDVTDPRSISTAQLNEFIETVLLGIIVPSCEIGRTQMLGVYKVYRTWDSLRQLCDEYTEQPFFKDWSIGRQPYMFYCPLDNVNSIGFPNSQEEWRARGQDGAN